MSTQFSLYDPNQLNFMQQMAPYQAPSPAPIPQDWGFGSNYTPLSGNLNFGGSPTAGLPNVNPIAGPTYNNKYSQWWGENGQAVGSTFGAISGLFNLYAGIKQLSLMNKNFKLAEKSTKQNFNANAIAHNNQVNQHIAATESSKAGGMSTGQAAAYQTIPEWI